jgi:hypothetical protein
MDKQLHIDNLLLKEATEFYEKRREENYWFGYLAKRNESEELTIGSMVEFAEHIKEKDNKGLPTSIKDMLLLFGFKHKEGDTFTCLNIDVKIRNVKEIKPAFENFLAKVNNRGYSSAREKYKKDE